jgi:hypothetical protein
MLHLQQYGSSDEEGNSDNNNNNDFEDITSHLRPLDSGKTIASLQNEIKICSAPDVAPPVSLDHNSSTEI